MRAAGPPRLHDRRAAAAPAGLVDDAAAGGPITRNLIFGVEDKFSQAARIGAKTRRQKWYRVRGGPLRRLIFAAGHIASPAKIDLP